MPYNPGVRDESARFMFEGISSAGRSLGGAAQMMGMRSEAMKERDKQEAKEAKRTRAVAKMFKEDWGLGDSDVESLDVDTLKGIMDGQFMKTNQQAQKLRTENEQLKNTVLKQQQAGVKLFNQIMRGGETSTETQLPDVPAMMRGDFGAFGQSVQDGMNHEGTKARRFDPRSVMDAAAEAGLLTPDLAARMMDDPSFSGVDPTPKEATIGGNSWVYSPKTGQFQRNFDPMAMMGEGGGVRRVPVLDDDGQPTGEFMVPNGKGGFTKGRSEKVSAPQVPWLFTEDEDEFKRELEKIDPKQRDAILAARIQYNRALGKADPLADLIKGLGSKERGAGSKAPPPAETPAKSKRLRYNPDTGKLEPVS